MPDTVCREGVDPIVYGIPASTCAVRSVMIVQFVVSPSWRGG